MLIFDPTNSVSPAGSLEPELQGTYGLLLAGAKSRLIRLPVLQPDVNALSRKGTFTLGADGSLSGDVEERREGNTGDVLRHLYLEGNTSKFEERERRFAAESLSDFTLTELTAEHAAERSTPLSVHFHVSVNHYGKHAGSLLLVRPAVIGDYRPDLNTGGKVRLYPVALGREEDIHEEYTIQLPPGYRIDDLPAPVSLKSSFAHFETKTDMVGNALHTTRELSIEKMEVPASAYSEYVDFFTKVSVAEQDEALLKAAP